MVKEDTFWFGGGRNVHIPLTLGLDKALHNIARATQPEGVGGKTQNMCHAYSIPTCEL